MPMNDGGRMTLYFVNERTSVASIGPAVKMTNPMSHGSRKRNAHFVCSDRRQRPRVGTLALAPVMNLSSCWSTEMTRQAAGLLGVDGVLRLLIRLRERVLRRDALVQDPVDRFLPDPLELLGGRDRRQRERDVGRLLDELDARQVG